MLNGQSALGEKAKEIRALILESAHAAQTGHTGPSLSMVELLVSLYFSVMSVRPDDPTWSERDILLLSKGHGSPGLYATLAVAGFFPREELKQLRGLGSRLQGHPKHQSLPGIEASTGSLGQGLSLGVGLALGFKLRRQRRRVYCILGDGELQEGQNWEAAMSAAAFELGALTAIVDRNRLQGDGDTEDVMPIEPLEEKWLSFGWSVHVIDGHDFDQVLSALSTRDTSRPTMVIANTVKGKGVSYMEHSITWHHHPMTDDDLRKGLREIWET